MARNLGLEGVTAKQMISMAEGLEERGELAMADQLYRVALKEAGPPLRRLLLIRRGLLKRGRRSSPTLRKVQRLLGEFSEPFVGDGLATWQKSLPFLEDERFVGLAEKHQRLLPVANWHWNLQTALWAVQQAQRIEGDFVELGVFRGHTTLFCAEYVDFAAWPKTWFLYDTFEGVPEDQLDPGWEDNNRAAYNPETFSFEEVRDRFAQFPNIRVIKGRVPEVLGEVSPERIAFVHMDLNNSTAEVQALDALFDRLSPGGVILFDDYGWLVSRAQYDAETAWFAKRGLRVLLLPTGQGVFVKT